MYLKLQLLIKSDLNNKKKNIYKRLSVHTLPKMSTGPKVLQLLKVTVPK